MSARRSDRTRAAALAAALFFSLPCAAQSDVTDATQRGLQLRREWRDAEALAEFRRAYALAGTPRLRAQIAFAEQALGRWREAEVDLNAALANADDPWISSSRPALEAARAQIADHLATLNVTASVPGASLRVGDDAPVTLPCAFRVEAGSVRVRVEANGFEPATRLLTADSGAVVTERFDLVASVAPTGSAPEHLPPPPPVPLPAVVPAVPLAPPPPAPTSVRARVAWTALGGAGLALGFGVVETVLRENAAVAYNDNTRCPPGQKQALCGAYSSDAQTATVLSVVGYGAALSLAATGALLLLSPAHKGPRLSALAGGGFVGGALSGAF